MALPRKGRAFTADTTSYSRALVPGDTTGPQVAKAGAGVPGAYVVRQVDTVVNNTDPNLTNTDTFGDQETSIAINPNNYNEIVISAFSGAWGTYPSYAPLWLSRDGGRTWTKEFTVGEPYNVSGTTGAPDDQTFDYGAVYTGNNLSDTVLFGTFLAGGNLYTGDIFDPALVGNWAYYSPSSGSPTEQTNRLAISDGQADQPWLLRSRSTFSADTQFVYVAYGNFGTTGSGYRAMDVSKSDGNIPPHFPNGYSTQPGTSANGGYNPGFRLASDPRNGWMYAMFQNCINNCVNLTDNPKEIEYLLNRTTDDGFTWSLNGQSGGIPIVISYSTQPQPKFSIRQCATRRRGARRG